MRVAVICEFSGVVREALRRAGHDEPFISEVARVMEYSKAYEIYRDDRA